MDDRLVELDVIAPVAGKRLIRASQIVSCMQSTVVDLPRVVVRLIDGSALIVTEMCLDAAGISIIRH